MDDTPQESIGEGRASGPADRPTNFVAGVMHDRAEFDRALTELVTLGIDERSIGVLYGERGAQAIAERPRRWIQELLGDENQYIERYEEEIRQGGFVVGVPLDQRIEGQRERVRDILRAHGAHYIVSSSRWTYSIDD